MEHFGVLVKPGKYGLKLSRDTYAIINPRSSFSKMIFRNNKEYYADEEGRFYTDEWCQEHRKNCLANFDKNMQLFLSLNHDKFNEELKAFLKKHPRFVAVKDLKDYDNVRGCYLMILDKYCQIYVGVSDNVKRRIQQHWSNQKSFDRLLLPIGAVNTSVMSIDCFRALDTTRIFVCKTNRPYEVEDKIISCFSQEYLCNRIGGGILDGGPLGLMQALSSIKSKDLESKA